MAMDVDFKTWNRIQSLLSKSLCNGEVKTLSEFELAELNRNLCGIMELAEKVRATVDDAQHRFSLPRHQRPQR